jgi:VIT1/CCC1 family predicted Fe2+/Mn2+ transporter
VPRSHRETHRSERAGWLRAAVLGANDGTISVASLVVGVAASGVPAHTILVTGVAGLVAGALSMAAGEYVSVQSQADVEHADLAREREELRTEPERELEELTSIYVKRGLDRELAARVAAALTHSDALGSHARDELGITPQMKARPMQAAAASACAFAAGAVVPLVAVLAAPPNVLVISCTAASIAALAVWGAAAATTGGASSIRGALRVAFWGAIAMAGTAAIGTLFHVRVV